MAEFADQGGEVNARILYWGIEGAGKTTNLRVIHSKLRPDHRGALDELPTRLDPTVSYAVLPIELGQIGGVRTRIQIVAAPGGAEHAPTRKQLLDEVDGVVFVVAAERDRVDENLASFEELQSALTDYGRDLHEVPLVIQYNKRDSGDPFALEELHRKLSMPGVAAFEASASEGTAVLQTLTTISKRVIRKLRERPESVAPTPAPSAPAPMATGTEPAAEAPPSTPVEAAPLPDPAETTAPEPPPVPVEAAAQDVTQILEPWPEAGSAPADPGLDPSLLAREGDAAADTASHAESLFEISFQEATRDAPADMDEFTIQSVGEARLVGPRAVRVPLVVDDGPLQRRLTLTIQLDPEEDR